MLRIDWLEVVYGAFVLTSAGLGFWAVRRNERVWIRDVRERLGGRSTGPRTIAAQLEGIPFRVIYRPEGSDSPRWIVEIPGVGGPSFIGRLQSTIDTGVARLGLEREAKLADHALNERLWLGTNDPDAVTGFLHGPGLAEALARLWPLSESATDGQICWVSLGGNRLAAKLDVSRVSQATFDDRLLELVHRVLALARALRAAPHVQSRALPLGSPDHAASAHREFAAVGLSAAVVFFTVPLIGLATGVSLLPDPVHIGAGAALGGLFATAMSLRTLRTPSLRQWLWRIPVLASAGAVLGFVVPVLNLVPAAPARTEWVEVLDSGEADLGPFKAWRVVLEPGTFLVPPETGVHLKKGDRVRATWRRGLLERPRLLAFDQERSQLRQ